MGLYAPVGEKGEGAGKVSVLRCYLSLSPGVSFSIWSHTCGSWYLPRFLFKDGSLALMYMASLMCLVVPCVSLWTMLKQSGLTGCPMQLLWRWMGEGRGPWDAPWVCPPKLCQSLLCTQLDSWWLGICIDKWLHIFETWCPCLWGP